MEVFQGLPVFVVLIFSVLDGVLFQKNDDLNLCLQGCLGALDGTYINVRVRAGDTPRYRTRKVGWRDSENFAPFSPL